MHRCSIREPGPENTVSINCKARAAASAEDRHKGIIHAAISKANRVGGGRAGM